MGPCGALACLPGSPRRLPYPPKAAAGSPSCQSGIRDCPADLHAWQKTWWRWAGLRSVPPSLARYLLRPGAPSRRPQAGLSSAVVVVTRTSAIPIDRSRAVPSGCGPEAAVPRKRERLSGSRGRHQAKRISTSAEPAGQNGLVTDERSAMSEMLPLRDTDPREVGVYRLLGRLGEGGQGVVFLAVSPTGSRAAVKLLPPTTDPLVRSRFLKEVAAAQRLARFCTAQVLDAGIFERRPFIVSEYVSGPSLVEVVEQLGPRSGAVLERIAVATLTALGAVHAAGMVHRDFKPGNVLLGPDGPVVIDFGLAAVPGMTTTGPSGQVAVGTPAFMAPEQLAGVRVTAAADMWSWAVTIAFTGTGELPFKGESLTATAFAILNSDPAVGRLPEPLGFLVRRCLNKAAGSRTWNARPRNWSASERTGKRRAGAGAGRASEVAR